jgi:malate dehydrogenase (oxaloacetate-decarboxylating)(NADP+)
LTISQGDLGAHGMGIPIGKLGLYCAAGGISPEKVLPIFVDVGTNNESLLQDGNYLGVRSNRLEGDQYFQLFDEFMFAVCNRWPHVFVQFEDFESSKAEVMLERYSSKYRCFNDDIQGTGCVTLSGLITACRISGTILTKMKILCVGAGSAGIGVCSMIAEGMIQNGMDKRNAMKNFVLCTSKGALGREDDLYGNPNTKRGIKEDHLPWVNPEIIDGTPIEKVMEEFQPTVLLGLSKQQGLFTEQLIRQMSNQCHQIGVRPIVMPMSNPLSKSECTAEEAYQWTNGEVIVASGSPFPPVTISNGKTYQTSQCNNMFIFPGIGLAASVGGIKKITKRMLYQAAVACSEAVTSEEENKGQIFPGLDRIRQVSHSVATVIIDEAIKANLAPNLGEREITGISELVVRSMHFPRYFPLVSK